MPSIPMFKRVTDATDLELISIPLLDRIADRVKAWLRILGVRHRNRVGQVTIERPDQSRRLISPMEMTARNLRDRVYPRVCATAADDLNLLARQRNKCILKRSLDRRFSRLDLPTGKSSSVVGDRQLE